MADFQYGCQNHTPRLGAIAMLNMQESNFFKSISEDRGRPEPRETTRTDLKSQLKYSVACVQMSVTFI